MPLRDADKDNSEEGAFCLPANSARCRELKSGAVAYYLSTTSSFVSLVQVNSLVSPQEDRESLDISE